MTAVPFSCEVQPIAGGLPTHSLMNAALAPDEGDCPTPGNGGGSCGGTPPVSPGGTPCENQVFSGLPSPSSQTYYPSTLDAPTPIACIVQAAVDV